MTSSADVNFHILPYDVFVKNSQKTRKKVVVMKKFVALGVALFVLLFSFLPAVDVAEGNAGIQVCDDLEPDLDMYD